MGFLRNLFGGSTTVPFEQGATGRDDQLAEVTVGSVTMPAHLFWNYSEGRERTSGVTLSDPTDGKMLTWGDRGYPDEFLAAGAKLLRVTDLLPDAQADAFALGRRIVLVEDPDGIVVTSADGVKQAGYLIESDAERVRRSDPRPTVGVVLWISESRRTRTALSVLVGPTVEVRVYTPAAEHAEHERRERAWQRRIHCSSD